jgi:hypothetical protein
VTPIPARTVQKRARPKSTTPLSPLPKPVLVDAVDLVGTRDGEAFVRVDQVIDQTGAVDEDAVE